MEICSLSTVPSSKNQEQIFYNSGNFSCYTHTYATNYYLILYNNSMNIILLTQIVKKIFSNTKPYKTLISNGLNSMRSFLEISITLYVTSITLLLIVISNCSLLNPGPKSIQSGADSVSVYYQNINGLLAFSTLGQEHLSLNITKHTEFQSYIITYNPDIIIINETWLKPSILDNEILPINNYDLFRLDRSSSSHPPDPVNPKKFKQNGGGILIGIKNSLDLKPKIVTSNVHAEILSITLALKGNKKICITTCYRVGTLGHKNLAEISDHLQKISSNKYISNHIVIGDFNLESVNWENNYSTSSIQRGFLELFDSHCFAQLISEPTHYHGKTLDILLTDSPHVVSNVKILNHNEHIKSNHFAINFDICIKNSFKRTKPQKRQIYNYKKANWEGLNEFLLMETNWHEHIDYCDIHTGWENFKNILSKACDRYIPKIVVKDNRQLSWFDAEVHKLCIKKERLRNQYKISKNPEHYKSFSATRKKLKCLVKSKMRVNLNDKSNPNILTKKFWSYVKSTSNTSRIPTQVLGRKYMLMMPKSRLTCLTNISTTSFRQRVHTAQILILQMIVTLLISILILIKFLIF